MRSDASAPPQDAASSPAQHPFGHDAGLQPAQPHVESRRFRGVRGKTALAGASKLRAWLNLAHHPLRFINFASCSAASSPLVCRRLLVHGPLAGDFRTVVVAAAREEGLLTTASDELVIGPFSAVG